MMKFAVCLTVRQISAQLQDTADEENNPAGEYKYIVSITASNDPCSDAEEKALDLFHRDIAIGCLDDFEIIATVESSPADNGAKN